MKGIPCFLVAASLSFAALDAKKPNMVFILADDLGIGDLKCYGMDRCKIDTPSVDQLASEGVRFTDAHSSASVCVPTRVAIMTGRYPWRFSPPGRGGPWGFLGPRFGPEIHTLGDALSEAGYHTGYVGKWHLGTRMVTTDGKTQGPQNVNYGKPLLMGPLQHGFKYSFILPGSLDMYPYAFARNNVWQGNVTASKGWSAFHRVGPAEKGFEDHQVLETFYREAEDFLSRQKKGTPFFLFLALTSPHTPTSPGVKFQGKADLGLYGDFVMETDHAVKRVQDALLKHGFDKNTLTLFSSDHGAASYAGNIRKATANQIELLEEKGHFPSGPYKGYKFSVYEGGLRVPLIAKWPGVIPAGTTCNRLVGLNDLFATFSEVAEYEMPPGSAPDSISFLSLLKKPKGKGTRTNLVMQSTGPMVIRDNNWKLCLCPGSGSNGPFAHEPKSEPAWKQALASYGKQPRNHEELLQPPFLQLYDLDADPGEKNNLAKQRPAIVKRMVGLLRAQVANGRSTPGPKLENGKQKIHLMQRVPPFVWKNK